MYFNDHKLFFDYSVDIGFVMFLGSTLISWCCHILVPAIIGEHHCAWFKMLFFWQYNIIDIGMPTYNSWYITAVILKF
jgi:hypothetical protein